MNKTVCAALAVLALSVPEFAGAGDFWGCLEVQDEIEAILAGNSGRHGWRAGMLLICPILVGCG